MTVDIIVWSEVISVSSRVTNYLYLGNESLGKSELSEKTQLLNFPKGMVL